MTARGFSLVELLVATAVTLLVAGAALTLAESARWSLAVEPATADATRRVRDGVNGLSDAIGGAGGGMTVGDVGLNLGTNVPVVRPLTSLEELPGIRFAALWTLRALPGAGGRVDLPQAGPGGSLTLQPAGPCPLSTPVCGFAVGDLAVVFDGRGHFDLFEVAALSEAPPRVTPLAPLSRAYSEGALVLAARADRFGLVPQPDGSRTLTRVTWAGAREPMVDGVVDLEFVPWGRAEAPALRDADDGPGLASYGLSPPTPGDVDDDGVFPAGEHCTVFRSGGVPLSRLAARAEDSEGLSRLAPRDLEDGPWCPSTLAFPAYDADLLRLRRIDVRMRVEVLAAEFRGPLGRLFARGGTAAHDARRWVGDRTIAFAVAIGGR